MKSIHEITKILEKRFGPDWISYHKGSSIGGHTTCNFSSLDNKREFILTIRFMVVIFGVNDTQDLVGLWQTCFDDITMSSVSENVMRLELSKDQKLEYMMTYFS